MLEKTHTPAALLLGALAGVLAATLCILGSAAWMAKQGCSASMAWPLATVSVCVGGFCGSALAAFWKKEQGLLTGLLLGGLFAATLLLLLGLSAVGPVCIFLFTMLYGLGNGLLSAQLLAGADGKSILALLLLGIPAACAAGCLCMFGASALQVSGRIRAYSFRKTAGQACSGARELMGQYLLVIVVFLPLCGAATGVAYLSGKIL